MKSVPTLIAVAIFSFSDVAFSMNKVVAFGNSLLDARRAYADVTNDRRVDCDRVEGGWVCANFRDPVLFDVSSTPPTPPSPDPVPTPTPSGDRVAVFGTGLLEARRKYSDATNLRRVDCDRVEGGWVCASFENPTINDVVGQEPAPPTPVTPPTPPQEPESIIVNIDFENGQRNSGYPGLKWSNAGKESDDRVRVVVESTGNYAIAHSEVRGDVEEAGASRTESNTIDIKEAEYKEGDDVYYSFSVFFPEDWEFNGIEDKIIWQFKQFSSRPSGFFVQKYDRLYYRFGSNNRFEISDGVLRRGVWNDIRVHMKWSSNDDGRMEIDHRVRGEQFRRAVTYSGGNMFPTNKGYLKFGLYAPQFNNSGIKRRTVYHDNIRVGKTLESITFE